MCLAILLITVAPTCFTVSKVFRSKCHIASYTLICLLCVIFSYMCYQPFTPTFCALILFITFIQWQNQLAKTMKCLIFLLLNGVIFVVATAIYDVYLNIFGTEYSHENTSIPSLHDLKTIIPNNIRFSANSIFLNHFTL
jgi:uncharacterized membrane protein